MGGKSRKTGTVSKTLIEKLKKQKEFKNKTKTKEVSSHAKKKPKNPGFFDV